LPLAAGMSVLAEPLAADAPNAALQPAKAAAPATAAAPAAVLTVEGEIASRQTMPVSPPTIPFVWQYKLAQLAPEGMMVEAGQPIAVFEAGEVANQLNGHQSTLNDRLRAL
jgi:hypothetical protein